MKILFYIASLVCVSSVPISSVPERQLSKSLIGFRQTSKSKTSKSKWAYESNPFEGYMVVAQDRWCNSEDAASGQDIYEESTDEITHADCKQKCADEASCNYYLWRHDDDADMTYTCATYSKCGITKPFPDGHGGFLYKKLNANFVKPNYIISPPLPSTKLPQEDDLKNLLNKDSYEIGSSSNKNPCGQDCTLAMPRTSIERDAIEELVRTQSPAADQAWGGIYVWLGGFWNYTAKEWYWNDGTQITQFNWDGGEPGHLKTANNTGASNTEQDFLGLKRSNGKWHDFHGNDQGSNGREKTKGQQGVCESVQKYEEEVGGKDKYCCESNCNEVVILDTHCVPANQHCADEATTALWGNKENCRRSCSSDPNCNFYLWRHDPSADAPYTCATFKNCNTKSDFNDGDGGQVWKKIND